MKKAIIMFLFAIFLITLFGCGNKTNNEKSTNILPETKNEKQSEQVSTEPDYSIKSGTRFYNFYTDNGYIVFTGSETGYKKYSDESETKYDFKYEVSDNILTIDETGFPSEKYEIYKNYLIWVGKESEGVIPNTDKFNVTSKYKSETIAFETIYAFKDDGTINFTDAGKTRSGTYERNNEIISINLEDGTALKLLIYKNKVTNSVYYMK